MCIIIDANVASSVFSDRPHADFSPIKRWLLDENRNGSMVYGGYLATELDRVQNAKRMLRELSRAGRAFLFPDAIVDTEKNQLIANRACESDDPHVIALARISGGRTLCTQDRALQRDFRNPNLISNPRGSIYLRPQHCHLLRHSSSCPGSSRHR